MKPIYYTLLLLVAALSAQSCIKRGEDTSCVKAVSIYFNVDSPALRAIDIKEIKHIDLFAFDAVTKTYVAHTSASNVVITPDFFMTLPIGAGEYRFIAWANVNLPLSHNHNLTQAALTGMTYEELYVELAKNNTTNEATTHPHALFFGDLKNQTVATIGAQSFTIGMQKDTYSISLKVKGLHASANPYYLTVTDQNGRLNYENNIASPAGETIIYKTTCTFDDNYMPTGKVSVLKLEKGRYIPRLIFTEGNEELANIDLVTKIEQLLAQTPNATFANTHDFEIELQFEGNILTDINVQVWKDKIDQDEDIYPQ